MSIPSELEVDWAQHLVESGAQEDPEFAEALRVLIVAVEAGALDLAGAVAEALWIDGPHHDPARAYVLYHVAYALEGFTVAFANQSVSSSHYLGAVGDFRNEAPVSGLIDQLGLEALPALDAKAAELLRRGL